MFSTSVSLDITPTLVRFERLAGRFSDFTPVLGGRVDVAARRLIREQFETEGRKSAGGGGWQALSPTYLKQRQWPNRPILQQTRDLMDVLVTRGHPEQEVVLEPDFYSLTVAEWSDVYPRFIGHQTGTGGKNNSLPQREIIPDPLPKTFIAEVRRIVKSYVVTGKA